MVEMVPSKHINVTFTAIVFALKLLKTISSLTVLILFFSLACRSASA
jgi:hypothetical protein